jgi:hypothetical protein
MPMSFAICHLSLHTRNYLQSHYLPADRRVMHKNEKTRRLTRSLSLVALACQGNGKTRYALNEYSAHMRGIIASTESICHISQEFGEGIRVNKAAAPSAPTITASK